MSQENQTEDLNKSIDSLIDAFFVDAEDVQKSDYSQISDDSCTTADKAIASAPMGQDDATRGGGRPAQISDVPKTDEDGKRAKNYDSDISENEDKEEGTDEDDQVCAVDQVSSKGRISSKPNAPKVAPFVKSESGE